MSQILVSNPLGVNRPVPLPIPELFHAPGFTGSLDFQGNFWRHLSIQVPVEAHEAKEKEANGQMRSEQKSGDEND